MCSIDNSDLLQGLWYKFLNSSYKNKSENLLIFLRSLYLRSSKQRNQVGTIFITSDISGIAIILTKQFLNDLENISTKNDCNEKNNELSNLKIYLETEHGLLMLYSIEFIIEQILIAKRNNTDSMKSSVLKIILESELGNILATTLLSILTDMCLNSNRVIDSNFLDTIVVPEFTFTQFLRQDFIRSSIVKITKKQTKQPRQSEEYSTDDNDILSPNLKRPSRKIRRKFTKHPYLKSPANKNAFRKKKNDSQSVVEIGELCLSDMEDPINNNQIDHNIEPGKPVHFLTSLRIAAKLLYHIIPLDPSLHTDAVSIYLEVLKSCCKLLHITNSRSVQFQLQLLKLADELICNIALTINILVSEISQFSSVMTILLSHKVVDRLLEIYELFKEINSDLPVLCDINKLIFYIFIIVTKNILNNYSGSCRAIIHLFTCWYNAGGSEITQQTLNYETENDDFYSQLRTSKISLFSEICMLLSLLKDIPDEKKSNQKFRNREILAHHSDQFNYMPTTQKLDYNNKDVCCYASICHLILNNLVHLLSKDCQIKFLPVKKKQIYNHILASIKAISFCCTIDLLAFSNKLVTLLVNPMLPALKFIVIRFLQKLIEISFEFYKFRFACDCQYTSRHDVVSILRLIRNVCIPKTKESDCPQPYYNATFADLLHFIDWLAKIQDNSMKFLVIENVIRPILNRLYLHSSMDSSSYHEMIGESIFSLVPYLNYSWEIEDLQLFWSVCENFPKLKRNYYKCLTITLLSTRSYSSGDFDEKVMKTRIIDYLVSRVNFEILMKRMDHSSESITLLFDDVYIWQCFRILFTYNDEFRRMIFDNNGIDCCYVMLKEIIEFISKLNGENFENYRNSVFLLFESLMCLVIDGNMLKNIYYYEGYSYEIIWIQLQSSIVKYFPKEEIVAQQLIQSLLNCCFRHKWTVQNEIYQLRKLFLDSIVNINTSNNDPGADVDLSDLDFESSFSDNNNDEDACIRYDADVSSDLINNDDSEFQVTMHNLRDTKNEKANVFIDLNTSDSRGNNMEINTDFLRLFIKIILSLPIDNYHVIGQKALESVYNALRYVSDKNQRSFICDDFMEKMMHSIENILTSQSIPGLQLVLLKLLTLPYSCWCTASRLRFLISLSEKNPALREEILKILVEKAELISSLQPELSLIIPVYQKKSRSSFVSEQSIFDIFSDDKDIGDFTNFLIEKRLSKPNWKGLDFDNDSENSGFSVSMWIQLDGKFEVTEKKKQNEPKKNKKKSSKPITPTKRFPSIDSNSHAKLLLLQSIQDYVHILTIYSKEKHTNLKLQCFQVWCKPSTGTMMVRFYQRIAKSAQINEFENGKNSNTQINRDSKSLIFNLFQSQTFSRLDSTDSSLLIDANLQHSFTLIGESVMNNLLPLNNWNFLTITVNWKNPESGFVTWLINENVIVRSKLSRSSHYVFQGSSNIESFMTIGQVGMETNLSYQYGYNLGSLFIFEGSKLQTENDNLSLMFLSPNWDGGSMMMNSFERESNKVLGTVIMRIIVDKQISSDLGSVLLKRGQNILENMWVEKMNDLILNFLVGSFTCGNISRFDINSLYNEDNELVSNIFNYSPIPSIGFSKSRKEEFSSPVGKCFNKHFLMKTSIDSAVENLGGIRLLVFWMAKSVENNDEKCTRWILKLILLLIRKSIYLAYQNIQEKGYSDLLQIFKSFKMKMNYEIIGDLVQHMTYEDPIKNKPTPLNSKLCRDPHILYELLIQWKILATSKLNAIRNEISMKESQALVLDKYLLHQINNLISEDNVYSIINCSSLGVMGILSPLLMACQEPFDALEHPLPPEICHLLLQIINNLIPTSVDLDILVKLCNTILQLFPVSMKDNDINNGRYYRHLKAFTNDETDTQGTDPPINDDCEVKVTLENSNTEMKRKVFSDDEFDSHLSVSLLESKVSEVEKKALQQFYYSTLSDNPLVTNETNDLMEIELSNESLTSLQSSCRTLTDGNENNFVNTSFETTFITSTNLTEKPIIHSHCESSRVDIISGLISTLENVIEVKVSDSVLEKCSIQDFCFEFILHLLSHSFATIRQKSLSLFRVYLYRKKSLIHQTNNQPSMINMVSHVIHQNTTTKEILAEAISIIFGQNLLKLIMDIDWENHSNVKISNHYDTPKNSSTDSINPICKLHGIISNQPEIPHFNSSLDEFINSSSNHFGLLYRRSAVLMQSILSNIDYESILWALKLINWLFINNNVLLQACLKTGLLEFICNCASIFPKESISKSDPKFEAFIDLCRIVAVNLTMSSINTQFYKLLELCDILHVTCLKTSKQLMKSGNFSNEIIVHHVLQNILISIIETVCIINMEDPAFSIQPVNFYIQKIVIKYKLLTHHFASQKMLNEKLVQSINSAIGIIINSQKCIYSYYFELCKLMGLNLVDYSMTIISNCLACNQTPDEYSIFLGCKEIIKSNLGDLIVCLTHSKFSIEFRLDVVKCIFKFENFNRVVRYCLLGNSSGSLCMIINIKQILDYMKQIPNISNDLVNNISMLLSVANLDFPVENLNEDSRSLWIKDCELKHNKWKEKFKKKLFVWNENADRNFNEVSIQMKNSFNNYRSYARKNLQQEYFSNIRNQRAAEFFRRKSWKVLTNNLTQEGAIWENVNKRSLIYRLDPTEGPSRIRRRMIKTTHKLNKKYFNCKSEENQDNSSNDDLNFLFDATYQVDKMVFESPIDCQLLKCIEDVRVSCPCIWVSLSGHFKGEFFVGSSRIGFLEDRNNNHYSEYDELPNHLKDFGFINWRLNEIELLFKRRFKLRDCALELIMKDGRNCLIAMNSTQERDNIVTYIETFLPSNTNKKHRLIDMQNRWTNGEISNFDYLIYLNTAAGRSYNDIMQYPVFPFILTDYSNSILDLTKESTFRDLSKPISIQKSELREKVVNSFLEKKEEYQRQLHILQTTNDSDDMSVWAVPPYHYSSLYSNSATVLYYMIRIPPFTQKFIQFQDGEFDRPDRLFHTLSSAWDLSTSSVSCMKEIIPEFFYLPEMFINSQDFKFGERLNGVKVDDVILPKWCSGDARLFCLIHRASLESPYVSNQLNHWIDLVFGFKQTGKPALEAINLFHPYTYYKAISPDDIVETIRRHAVEQMIENYGQISKQLFQFKAHSTKKINWKHFKMSTLKRSQSTVSIDKGYLDVESVKNPNDSSYESIKPIEKDKKFLTVLNGVHGIDWGDWVGSPDNSQTFINDIHKKKEKITCKLFLLPMTKLSVKKSLKLLVIPQSSSVLMLPVTPDGNQPIIKFTITPNKRRIQVDSVLYGNPSNNEIQSESIGSFLVSNGSGQAFVTSITISQRSGRVFFGMESGLIEVYQGDISKYSQLGSFVDNFTKYWKTLLGHTTTVTHLVLGESFAVLASCDDQNNVAIWESQTLELIHYIDWLSVKYVPSSKKLNTQSCSNSNLEEFLHNEIPPIQSDSISIISAMCFSETLGDLVISRLMRQKIVNYQVISNISLFTINGKHVDSIMLSGKVVSLSYTNLTEGRHVNAIAAITNEGRLTVMSSWNLQVVWKVKIPNLNQSDYITSIQYTHSGRELYAIHESGHVQVLQSNRPDLNSRQYVYFWI